ncbi:MCE family protein [Geodermatophilus nigrescens]|uniref:Phospholipid/cholesterol/gamma-HCH transport system substrate-binding protein n=1 Tax=Geodermatophilus nigrescens TaxID=1070870 RepID=A0A1M5MU34_9ACTN|nr:MlaD family protein [Geodermatophilus nigrescens]SHG80419.1 phospholipid/cholesterol/gamma-HCH transport system substrate-binding protein [Geodermatophilus nigrescens]
MITRRVRLQLLAFATVALLGISYVGFTYVGLDRVLLGSGYDVSADFADSGGVFVNAEVTHRGVAVGRVSDMQLTDDGVRVTMTIEPGADPIPADTDAVVATRSAVGEQYLDLRPATADGPYLEDGAVIPQSRTAIPVPVEQLLLDVDELVTSLDAEDLRVVVDELGRAFAGAGDDLTRLIDNGDLLLARAEESLPETLRLITDGRTVLETQAASRSAIEQWAADLRAVSDTLVDIDPDLRGLVVNAPDAGAALQRLVDDAGPGLGSLVRGLDVLNGVTIPRLDGVEQLLVTYPDVVSGGFSVVRNDGGTLRAHFGLVLGSDDPRACTSGYVSTGQTPTPGSVATVDVDAVGCDVVDGVDPSPGDGVDESGSNIRGEQNIGRDGGVGSPGPQGQPGAGAPGAAVLDDVVGGLLGASPFARTQG